MAATAYSGGGEFEVAYGLRNWIDLDGELVASGFGQASYTGAQVLLGGSPTTGHLVRTTRLGQLRLGATLRTGVTWVATLHLGLGVGGRERTEGQLMSSSDGHVIGITPDGLGAGVAADAAAVIRLGVERRIDRRWSVGVSGEAVHMVGIGAPPIDGVSAGISVSYTWYPLLPW